MGDYRPEIVALAGFLLSIIVRICTAYSITITADEGIQLSVCIMWLISRILRKYAPDENARNIEQIKSNLAQQQNNDYNEKQAPATTIANTIPAAVIVAATKAAEKQ